MHLVRSYLAGFVAEERIDAARDAPEKTGSQPDQGAGEAGDPESTG
jgi:hypothetical protein